MKRISVAVLICLIAQTAFGFEIVIDRGVDQLSPIAVVPFGVGENAPDLTPIVHSDLYSSGQFNPVPPGNMLSLPAKVDEVALRDWTILGVEYVVVGYVSVDGLGLLTVDFGVVDVTQERTLLSGQVRGSASDPRGIAHRTSDEIFRAITGNQGAFSTKVAYVQVQNRTYVNEQHSLIISDFDGERPETKLVSKDPILSPTWSPDGEWLAYVSFEEGSSAIYMMNIASEERFVVANFEGINGAPTFSPDGTRIAMVSSRDGNPEIYVIEIQTGLITRVTNHRAIDTEPVWELNGERLLFTSDRGGTPQIYRVELDTKRVNRLTYVGSYNARPRILPDNEHFIFVHRSGDGFHIAWRDLAGEETTRILSSNVLDESPSVSPNGVMLMYSTKKQSKGILSIVSVDGEVEYNLTSSAGDVIEPAWSPYLPLATVFVEQ